MRDLVKRLGKTKEDGVCEETKLEIRLSEKNNDYLGKRISNAYVGKTSMRKKTNLKK